MPSHPPVRLTKKQRKATAFRERGIKSKGTGKQNPAPGPPRLGRRHSPSTGDNGEGHHDHHHDEDEGEDDEDANAVPAMEDQDQAMAEMDSAAAQKKKKKDKDKDKKKRSRADDGEAPPASKKARHSRGSDEIPAPLAREDDEDEIEIGATRMNVLKDGESGEHESESETKDKGSKQRRYILFIGMSLPSPSFPEPTESFAVTRSSKGTSSTPRRARQSKTISPSAVRSHPVLRVLCH